MKHKYWIMSPIYLFLAPSLHHTEDNWKKIITGVMPSKSKHVFLLINSVCNVFLDFHFKSEQCKKEPWVDIREDQQMCYQRIFAICLNWRFEELWIFGLVTVENVELGRNVLRYVWLLLLTALYIYIVWPWPRHCQYTCGHIMVFSG